MTGTAMVFTALPDYEKPMYARLVDKEIIRGKQTCKTWMEVARMKMDTLLQNYDALVTDPISELRH